mgnify:CR=1 FL=1
MALKFVVTAAVAVLLMAGGAWIVLAQDEKPEEPKGVTTRGLVGSTGAIPRLAMTIPVVTRVSVDPRDGAREGSDPGRQLRGVLRHRGIARIRWGRATPPQPHPEKRP